MNTSKETLSNVIAKIKWGRRPFSWVVLFIVLALVILGAQLVFGDHGRRETTQDGKQYTLVIPSSQSKTYQLTTAYSAETQMRGLGDTPQLAPETGMLFWYDNMAERCFWMKDMRYALDIVWLDANKKVVHIERNLTPQSYPETFCAVAKYVVELNTGAANKSGMARGQVLSF